MNKDAVIDWFKSIPDKSNCTFVIFDIEDFYPSISEKLLRDSIEFAERHVEISDSDKNVLFHCRKSLLFLNNKPWVKSRGNQEFDVAMGSHDGAEICELVGIYLLSLIAEASRTESEDTGLYRDDGLAVIRGRTGRQADVYRKKVTKIMKDNGLRVQVRCNLKSADYLDITFNLEDGTYKPFKKPNNNPRYVHTESNHPENIKKQIPISISKRISDNSCNEAIFNNASPYYNERLREAGYSESMQYIEEEEGGTQTQTNRRNRRRNIVWFNPPYCKSVETNVGRTFLRLVDKHFPRTHRYHKIFNRNTIKVSYSCMDNMENIIKQHNSKILRGPNEEGRGCNCQNPDECPLNGECLSTNVAYSAVVTHQESNEEIINKTYLGVTEPEFKKRHNVHQHTFRYRDTPNDTSLSKYIWELKDKGIEEYNIKWSIVKRATGYRKTSKTCGLCLTEKLLICEFEDKANLINSRSELVSKCRHQNKHLLKNCNPG